MGAMKLILASLMLILASFASMCTLSGCQSQPGVMHPGGNAQILYVSSSSDCGGQLPCYTSLQDAVDAASPEGDLIKVAEGVYTSTEAQIVAIEKSLHLVGGYSPDNWSSPRPEAHPTILDAEGVAGRRAISINARDVSTVTVQGVWVRRGVVQSPGGAGVHVIKGAVVIKDSVIEACAADRLGGGVLVSDGVLHLEDTELRGNRAQYGSALYVQGGTVVLERNTFVGNEAPSLGGAIAVNGGAVTGTNNMVVDNPKAGTGVYLSGGHFTAHHWTLVNNGHYALLADLGIDIDSGSALVQNSIIARDSGGLCGSGAAARHTLFYEVDNPCIAGASCVSNLFGDPKFVDPTAGDYHIGPDSAAVDRAYSVDTDHDIDGDGRPLGSASDLGADEVQPFRVYLPVVTRRFRSVGR